MKEAYTVNLKFGAEGHYQIKVLAVLNRIDPQDDDACTQMVLKLIQCETAVMLDKVHTANPKGGDDGE